MPLHPGTPIGYPSTSKNHPDDTKLGTSTKGCPRRRSFADFGPGAVFAMESLRICNSKHTLMHTFSSATRVGHVLPDDTEEHGIIRKAQQHIERFDLLPLSSRRRSSASYIILPLHELGYFFSGHTSCIYLLSTSRNKSASTTLTLFARKNPAACNKESISGECHWQYMAVVYNLLINPLEQLHFILLA